MNFNFIYPGNLKEQKTFFYLTVVDLAVLSALIVIFTIYSAQNSSFIPLSIPASYFVVKVRLLENSSNIWEQLVVLYDYLVNSQQLYFWGRKNK